MYALVIAGGFAKRLWPLTKEYPKPLLPVGNLRIIEHVMNKLLETNKIKHFFVATNKAFERVFRGWISKFSARQNISLDLIIEPSISEYDKLGAIRGIAFSLNVIRKKYGLSDLIVVAADNIFTFDLSKLIERMYVKEAPVIAAYKLGDRKKARRYGIIKLDAENRVLAFKEKPSEPFSDLIATAIYAIPQDKLAYYHEYLELGHNPDAPGYFFEWLVKKTNVYAEVYQGKWHDIGTLQGYISAITDIVNSNYIDPTAKVEGKIDPPVVIGSNVQIDSNSKIGPYSIVMDNAKVEDSRIERSLILEGSVIARTRIEDSLIGSRASIEGGYIYKSILACDTKLRIANEITKE